jgi:FlaA1/EpsC-like NDP-sugar epimerase
VARRMIAMSGKSAEIVFTGLRAGEKMHEDLLSLGDNDSRPLHPLISHVRVVPLDPDLVLAQPWSRLAARPRTLAAVLTAAERSVS